MRFVVSAALLGQLRRRREQQRARRAAAGIRTGGAANGRALVDRMKHMFAGANVSEAAGAYVAGMNDLQDEVEREHDAFLLDPGMGPMSYLTADGRVLLDFRSFDGDPLREADDNEAIATVVVGARKTGMTTLLSLVPPMPPGAATCARCRGTREDPLLPDVVCLHCYGRGWQTAPAR